MGSLGEKLPVWKRWEQEDFPIEVTPESDQNDVCGSHSAANKSFRDMRLIIHSWRLKANSDQQIAVTLETTKIMTKGTFAFYLLLKGVVMVMLITVTLQFVLFTSQWRLIGRCSETASVNVIPEANGSVPQKHSIKRYFQCNLSRRHRPSLPKPVILTWGDVSVSLQAGSSLHVSPAWPLRAVHKSPTYLLPPVDGLSILDEGWVVMSWAVAGVVVFYPAWAYWWTGCHMNKEKVLY